MDGEKEPVLKQKITKVSKETKRIQKEIAKSLLTLTTAGFGLVAALAWNEAIQTFFRQIIDPYLKIGSGIAGRFIYALLITVIVVFVTYQLSKIAGKK